MFQRFERTTVKGQGGRLGIAAVASVLLLALGLASPALARPAHGEHGRSDLSRLERGLSRLGLAAETEQAVTAVLDEARPQLRALHDQIRDAHRSLRESLEAETVDETAVLAQVDAIGALRTEARKAELQTLLRVRSLLSPEEREQLKAMREKHRGRWHEGKCDRSGKHGERDARHAPAETDV